MKRNTLNFVVDAISGCVMAGMVGTGLLLRYVLPPGSGQRLVAWGWDRHEWGDVHFWLAAGVGAVMIVHVALHWSWVCTTAARCVPFFANVPRPGRLARNLAGAGFVVLLAGAFGSFVWVARAAVMDVSGRGQAGGDGPRHHVVAGDMRRSSVPADGMFIRGSTTLEDAARACGISVEVARARLGLGDDVPADEQLGRLSARYNFSIAQARERLSAAPRDAGRRQPAN